MSTEEAFLEAIAWLSLVQDSNVSNLVTLSALHKRDDVNSLEKCFSEWESGCSTYDIRISNVSLESYLNQSYMTEQANAVYNNMLSRGVGPNLTMLDFCTTYHTVNCHSPEAFDEPFICYFRLVAMI
ncbi:hypothetical protein Vadar_022241 [Vaccinium darrowii]|uniref:Uncharacterized protein n=1 Tax=Vaccinium darrowii TaxID=229202 RepID=A0ACB7X2P3_9ERIC|nr:hypothetical protein Vadar_022241 [Vaccinium darrowii]